jgi:integrase
VRIPGFKYDSRKRMAFLEVILPKTRGKVRRRKKASGVRNQAEALELYSKFRRSVLEPTTTKPDVTLKEYVDANWPISRDARRPVSTQTAAKEWSALRSRILPGLGHLRISEISDVAIEDFSAELLRQGLSNSTVNSRLRITRKVLAHARRRGKIPVPALDDWPCPLEEKELHQELSADEVGRFLGAFDTAVITGGAGGGPASLYYTERFQWAKPYFVLAIHLGLARGDLKNLRWTNVDLSRNLVQVERAKTGKTATIPLSKVAREAIEQCRTRPIVSAEYVLVTPEGERYSDVTIRRYFLVALKEAGIKRRIRPHDLRHSFGSLLVSARMPLSYVKTAMGHAHERTTQRYARVNLQALQAIAMALDGIN